MKKYLLNITYLFLTSFACFNTSAQTPNWQWAKGAGSAGFDYGRNIAIDTLGNVYTTGYYEGTVDFDPGAAIFNLTAVGGSDLFLLKLDPAGNFIWAKSIGGLANEFDSKIAFDDMANVYLTGSYFATVDFNPGAPTFNLTPAGDYDGFILKLDSSGNFIWAMSIGGIDTDQSYAITIDENNNIFTCGYFSATVDFDPGVGVFNLTAIGTGDAYISKLDPAGSFIWAKAMGGVAGSAYATALTTDDSGNTYYLASFEGTIDGDPGVSSFNLTATVGATDLFISKLDSAGNFVWAKGLIGYAAIDGTSIALDAAQNIYFSGYFLGTFDLNPGTATVIVNSFDGEEDVFVSKLDNSGNYLWGKTFGGMGTDLSRGLALDNAANVYITGTFRSTFDFDPGAGIFNMTPPGTFGIYISKLDSAGNFIYAIAAGGTGSDAGGSIAIDNTNDVYITGRFSSAVISFGTTVLTNASTAGNADMFIAKLDNTLTGIESVAQTNGVSIYPNPSNDYFIINLNYIPEKANVTISDVTGKIFYNTTFSGTQTTLISTKNFMSGMYFCVISIDGKSITKKLIKN